MQIQTAHYDLVTTWRGGMASRTLCQSFSEDSVPSVLLNHVIDSDEPVSLGGEGLTCGGNAITILHLMLWWKRHYRLAPIFVAQRCGLPALVHSRR